MSYHVPPSNPFENELYEAREHERERRADRDAKVREPSEDAWIASRLARTTEERRAEILSTYPSLQDLPDDAARERYLRRAEIELLEEELARLKAEEVDDTPITNAPF